MKLFEKIWDWIKGVGRKIAAVAVSIASVLLIGKVLSNKKAEREILKKEINTLEKAVKKEAKEIESGVKKVEESESRVEEALKTADPDPKKEQQIAKKADLKDILPDL